MPEISIIIRTKNEERWIGHCLEMIYQQDFSDFEIILVDNNSTDHTVQVANRYPLAKTIYIDKFYPGLAINQGIRASSGRYLVCISAHCIPKDITWLSSLLRNFSKDEKVAGVYGRQLPVCFTSPVDKRDLLTVFGLDRRVQIQDYFFHNANSMFRRDVWEEFPFDEKVTNVEDRVWGQAVTRAGYRLVYEPEASVYHHHGLNQGNAPERARGVVSVIEQIDEKNLNGLPELMRPENLNIAAIIPVQHKLQPEQREFKLLAETISSLKKSEYLGNIYLVTTQARLAQDLDVLSISRGLISGVDELGINELLQKSLEQIESLGDHPQSILYVNYDYLNRPDGLFDELIRDAQYNGCESLFPGFVDFGHFWTKNVTQEYAQLDESLKTRAEREPVYRALYGLGCITHTSLIRKGLLTGGKVGILPVTEFKCSLRLKTMDVDTKSLGSEQYVEV